MIGVEPLREVSSYQTRASAGNAVRKSILAQHVLARSIPFGGKCAFMTLNPLVASSYIAGMKSRSADTNTATFHALSQAKPNRSVTIDVSTPFSIMPAMKDPQ